MGRKFGIARDLKDGVLLCAVFPTQNFPSTFRLDQPERIQTSINDTDDSTRKTVQAMCRHIANAQKDPWFLAVAHNITQSPNLADKISSVFLWCKACIRFQRDEQSVWNLYQELNQVDFLIEPAALVRMLPRAYGDCDEYTMFSLAVLKALGVPGEIVTVACDPERPGYFSHVYGQVVLQDGRRLALDCSPAGKYPGWEVPDHDVNRKQVWDLEGNPVYDAPPASRDLGLHAYIPRPRANRGRRGMGQDTLAGGFTEDTSGNIVSATGTNLTPQFSSDGSSISSGGSGINWNALFSNLAAAGTKLGTIAITPRGGYVATGPGGQTVVSNTGLPATLSAFATPSGSNLLFWAAAAIGILLIAKAASK